MVDEEECIEKCELAEEQRKVYMELKVKCIKCEMEIKRIDYEEDVEPKKGEYVDDIIDFESPGCVGKGSAPGILTELINSSMASLSSIEEETYHGYVCDGCLRELVNKKIIEVGPDQDKEEFLGIEENNDETFDIDGDEFWIVQDSGKVRIYMDREDAFSNFIGGGLATCASIKVNQEGIEVIPLSPLDF